MENPHLQKKTSGGIELERTVRLPDRESLKRNYIIKLIGFSGFEA